jgi:transcriptional regulator with XRE-family HTH domain
MTDLRALTIRAKKLGVILRDARQKSHRTAEECARAVGVDLSTYEEFEMGEKSPSLPEMEALALFLNIPYEVLAGDHLLVESDGSVTPERLQKVIGLRQRIVGALVRQARLEAGISLQELAEKTWSSPTLLESYELGETAIPLPDLELLASILDLPLRNLRDQKGFVAALSTQQTAAQQFLDLPAELKAFVAKPVNQPYLELAKRLSEMNVEKLRAVAEGLLEITL